MSQVFQSLWDCVGKLQHNRLLRLSFPRNDGPLAQMLVNQFDAIESLSRARNVSIDLKHLS